MIIMGDGGRYNTEALARLIMLRIGPAWLQIPFQRAL